MRFVYLNEGSFSEVRGEQSREMEEEVDSVMMLGYWTVECLGLTVRNVLVIISSHYCGGLNAAIQPAFIN